MDPRGNDVDIGEGTYDSEASSEEDFDTSTMLRGIARQVRADTSTMLRGIAHQFQNFLDLVDKASILEKSLQGSTEPLEQRKRPAPPNFQAEASQGSWKRGRDTVGSRCNMRHRSDYRIGGPSYYRCVLFLLPVRKFSILTLTRELLDFHFAIFATAEDWKGFRLESRKSLLNTYVHDSDSDPLWHVLIGLTTSAFLPPVCLKHLQLQRPPQDLPKYSFSVLMISHCQSAHYYYCLVETPESGVAGCFLLARWLQQQPRGVDPLVLLAFVAEQKHI
ncbi:uncharacterized protein LOC131166639 [Malania oleifera]|uniref:uncharacterized protein LOC131166639 n=1 Tax=Malania oleifera TaxID=397392 RepID=UPI0025AE99CE|nr:uncharacterized protein LOC131166639 [Malania oleifera]